MIPARTGGGRSSSGTLRSAAAVGVSPQVFRPVATSFQLKGAAQPRASGVSSAPPVYRPQGGLAQAKPAPAVYRPNATAPPPGNGFAAPQVYQRPPAVRPQPAGNRPQALAPVQQRTKAAVVQRALWYFYSGSWHTDTGGPPPVGGPPNLPANHPDGRAWQGGDEYDDAAPPPVVVPVPVVYAITYGAVHGDLHFIAKPTKNKSAWSISKANALLMMRTAITNRMADIVAAATLVAPRALAWILVADATGKIGSSVDTASISRYQIQLQADHTGRSISFHGFPDDQALHTGLGHGRNNLT